MEDVFAKLASDEPDKGDEVEEEFEVPISASQAENTSPNDSDLESTLKRLFPFCDIEDIQHIAQFIMLGRVFPDNFSTKVYLIVTDLALKHYNDPKFDVISTMMIIEGLCQIGLEGKGRIEAVIVSGNTREVAEQESNKMGGF
jgi:hypothetical protein